MNKGLAAMRHDLDELDRPSRQKLQQLISRARAIVEKAIAEDRDFNADERQEIHRLMGADERGTHDGEIAEMARRVKIEDAAKAERAQEAAAAIARQAGRRGKTKVMSRSTFEALSAKEKMAWTRAGGTLVDG